MNITFNNEKTAVVTGGTGGIGSTIAKTLLESGAQVALIDVNADKLQETANQLSIYGTVKGYQLNVTDTSAIPGCIEKIRQEMGEIDVLIQAAGLLRSANGLELQPDEWDMVMNVNARGLFFTMQQVVLQSMKKRGGSIVNFSSMAGIRGMNPAMAAAHYSASKGAVVALAMQAAVEWAQFGVRVNALAPGGVLTPAIEKLPPPPEGAMEAIPLRQLSKPQDIANLAVFLASDHARMNTGQVMVIDGGSSVVGY